MEDELNTRVSSLERELADANDLLSVARQRGSLPFSEGEVLSLSPAAARASSLLKSGLTLTQIYSQFVEATESLQREKDENSRLNNYLEQIMQELDEKTPALQQLRRNYDSTLQDCEQVTQKLNAMFEECELLRMESEDAVREGKTHERENKRLKQLTADLGRQVQVCVCVCACACACVCVWGGGGGGGRRGLRIQAFFAYISFIFVLAAVE